MWTPNARPLGGSSGLVQMFRRSMYRLLYLCCGTAVSLHLPSVDEARRDGLPDAGRDFAVCAGESWKGGKQDRLFIAETSMLDRQAISLVAAEQEAH